MQLSEIIHSTIPWDLLFLCLENIDSLQINKHRKNALKKAVAARPESKIAQVIDSWFPEGQERIVLPLQATDSGEDPERRHKIDNMTTQMAGAYETFGFIASPQFLDQNLVYDEENHRAIKFQQAIDLIAAGRKPREGHNTLSYANTNNSTESTRYIINLTREFVNEKSYDKSDKVGTGEKGVIISRNPTDVATMSTGRPWTSCMNLKGGSHAKDVARGIKEGMIVAYLVLGSQEQLNHVAADTTKPIDALARIAIKPMERYMSKVDITNNIPSGFGWPEDRVYHANRADITGFRETVTEWTRNKIIELMGNKVDGKYKAKGGYTDSLEDFNAKEIFYDENNISRELDILLEPYASWVSWGHIQPIASAIYNQPRSKISDEVKNKIFKVLMKVQPRDKLANPYTATDKSLRGHMEPREAMTIKMLRKFPEVLPTVKNNLSPVVRDWLLGHTNTSFYRYLHELMDAAVKIMSPEPTDFMKTLTNQVNSAFTDPRFAHLAPDMNELMQQHTKVDMQGLTRLLSRIKVVVRTFVKEQGIFLPSGSLNMLLNVLQQAEGLGINQMQTQGIKELLPALGDVLNHNSPTTTS